MTDGLHGPETCPRRCSVCDAGGVSFHHWVEAVPDPDDPEDEYADHEAVVVFGDLAFYVCKHCDAWATMDWVEQEL